jgi:hypothetical protein
LASYYVFNAAAQLDPLFMPRAMQILHDGYTLLQQRAAKIEDLDLRHKFLENVWFNRDIAACWEQSRALSIRTL